MEKRLQEGENAKIIVIFDNKYNREVGEATWSHEQSRGFRVPDENYEKASDIVTQHFRNGGQSYEIVFKVKETLYDVLGNEIKDEEENKD